LSRAPVRLSREGIARRLGGYPIRTRIATETEFNMQIGTSLFLIAVGAIMRFAVEVDTEGFSINTAGTILMVAGAIGVLISLFMMTLWSGRRERVAERPVVRERDVY
jgi:hypothetical protein